MRHAYLSSSFLPNITKIFLRVSKLWSAQRWVYNFCFRGDIYITNKVSCLSCTRHAYWSSSSSLPNIIKLSQTVWELWPAQDFGFKGDNYIMKTVSRLSCMRHAYWSSSTFLPNIEICLRVSKLWSTQGCVYGWTEAMLIAISPEPIGRGIKMNSA